MGSYIGNADDVAILLGLLSGGGGGSGGGSSTSNVAPLKDVLNKGNETLASQTIKFSGFQTNRLVGTDGSKNLISSNIEITSDNQLNFLGSNVHIGSIRHSNNFSNVLMYDQSTNEIVHSDRMKKLLDFIDVLTSNSGYVYYNGTTFAVDDGPLDHITQINFS
jgi:hypothetical protein